MKRIQAAMLALMLLVGLATAAAAQQTLASQTTEAQKQAAQTVADAQKKRITEEGNMKAAKITAETQEEKAAAERQRILAEADQKKRDAETEDERQKKLREARDAERDEDSIADLRSTVQETGADARRIFAEWKTAEQSPAGHPLVNTTDQWTNTTLRRAIRQAIDQGADYIATAP
jgi:uncharacterized low-complexity protein